MIQVKNLRKAYPHLAVDDVSFHIKPAETLGLVGESGCGKSTVGKLLLRLIAPSHGTILFEGTNLTHLSKRALLPWRRRMQIVFQDPYSSLNPRMTIEQHLAEPLQLHRLPGTPSQLLEQVGLSQAHLKRYPHEFSGGQRQRIAIARALSVQPQFLVCDEPLSALDMATQHQVMELFKEIKQQRNMAMLFISHDLLAVREIADRIAVMRQGQIVEEGTTDQIFSHPQHPYTKALLDAIL